MLKWAYMQIEPEIGATIINLWWEEVVWLRWSFFAEQKDIPIPVHATYLERKEPLKTNIVKSAFFWWKMKSLKEKYFI